MSVFKTLLASTEIMQALKTLKVKKRTDPSVSSQEAVGDGSSQVKAHCAEQLSLHCQKLTALIGMVAYVQEVINGRWKAFLETRVWDTALKFMAPEGWQHLFLLGKNILHSTRSLQFLGTNCL